MFEMPTLALVEPMEEILVCVGPLPLLVVCAQITAVPMFLINHLEEVLQVHHLGGLFSIRLCFTLLPPLFGLVLGRIFFVVRWIRVVGTRSSRNLAHFLPFLARGYRGGPLALFRRGELVSWYRLFGAWYGSGRIPPLGS